MLRSAMCGHDLTLTSVVVSMLVSFGVLGVEIDVNSLNMQYLNGWEPEHYHVMWWFGEVVQSGDCCFVCAHLNSAT